MKSLSQVFESECEAAESTPQEDSANPFISHAFLSALEESGSATKRTGWAGGHVLVEDEDGELLACAPAYLKSHSQGEYVFDHGWADAYARAGGEYYPKLQVSVPFTPVTGPRLLVRPGPTGGPKRGARRGRAEGAAERRGVVLDRTSPSCRRRVATISARAASCSAPTSSSIGSTTAMAASTISSTRWPRASARR